MAATLTITSPHAGTIKIAQSGKIDQFYINLTNTQVGGSKQYLSDGVTLNPDASIWIKPLNNSNQISFALSNIITIGGAAPGTLNNAVGLLAALVAE